MSPDARTDRHALLELQALLTHIAALRSGGDADRFTADARNRWILHRLWIAAGNEALAYTQATGQTVRADKNWANPYDLPNHLVHSRLPDIDEGRCAKTKPPSRSPGAAACGVGQPQKPALTTVWPSLPRRRQGCCCRAQPECPPAGVCARR